MKHQRRKTRTKTTTSQKKYRKRRTQLGSFLKRYDFAYAGRDVANHVGKVAPGVTKNASSKINNVAEQGMGQIISNGGK